MNKRDLCTCCVANFFTSKQIRQIASLFYFICIYINKTEFSLVTIFPSHSHYAAEGLSGPHHAENECRCSLVFFTAAPSPPQPTQAARNHRAGPITAPDGRPPLIGREVQAAAGASCDVMSHMRTTHGASVIILILLIFFIYFGNLQI